MLQKLEQAMACLDQLNVVGLNNCARVVQAYQLIKSVEDEIKDIQGEGGGET